MFEYDRLALDVAEQFAQIRSNAAASPSRQIFDPFRTVSGLCFSPSGSDIFDCGASSGYGSPGTGDTPLSSPAPQVFSLPSHVQRALCDQVFGDDPENVEISLGPTVIYNEHSKKSVGSENDENLPSQAAQEDGFSSDEIAQFTQLLCSPKKAPPSKYQCHICYRTGHYISDCPMRFNSPYEELTPYQGRKKCYGEFQCQQCKRKWTSQNSVANEAQSCIKCHISVFPHKQLPVDKAVAMGLVKAQRIIPTKLGPIGHGRPPFNTNRQ
uniref:3CxxC-type domain-containing protein n=1 Tax=Setaria digitata TaxID=48799 RepID=A0A915Q1Y6_9BILA